MPSPATPLVELIFFGGCPHVEAARAALRVALLDAGFPPVWREWDQRRPTSAVRFHGYGSPTVLVNGADVTGAGPLSGGQTCKSHGAPQVGLIAAALYRHRRGAGTSAAKGRRELEAHEFARQAGVALRFMERLVLLTEAERGAIPPPAQEPPYDDALALVRRTLEGSRRAEAGARDFPSAAERFLARTDHFLDLLGITGDLWELARSAVRAILVFELRGAGFAARVVYQPFEEVIPYRSLQ